MQIQIPQIAVPNFWLANFGKVQDYLHHHLQRGTLHEIGQSARDYPVNLVKYPRAGAVKLLVSGGTHGHEPEGVVAVMNLIHLLESGRGLDEQPHARLRELLEKIHLFIVPCLNPDRRTVCPDTLEIGVGTEMIACN